MKRLLTLKQPVELFRLLGGNLLERLGVQAGETQPFVVHDEEILIETVLGSEYYLAVPVRNPNSEEERSCILVDDIPSLSISAKMWRLARRELRDSPRGANIRKRLDEGKSAITEEVLKLTRPYLKLVG